MHGETELFQPQICFTLPFPQAINATHSVEQLASLQAWQRVNGGVPDSNFL